MSDKNLNNMGVKELRAEVQLLRDELAIMLRKYEDILYNLDTENFSGNFRKEQENMRTAIEVAADGVKLAITSEELEAKNYCTVSLMSDTVKFGMQQVREDAKYYLKDYSTITQTADAIRTEVGKLYDDIKDRYSTIEQTADSISTAVSKNIYTKFKSEYQPDPNCSDELKCMLCEYDGDLFYFNELTQNWEYYEHANGDFTPFIASVFEQTAYGFELTGDVVINGNTYVGGKIESSSGYGYGYSRMDEGGFTVYGSDENEKVRIGCYNNVWDYPFITLGVGSGYAYSGAGVIFKLGNGIWIGDDSIIEHPGNYPGGENKAVDISSGFGEATGLFVDFSGDKIYKYIGGKPTQI